MVEIIKGFECDLLEDKLKPLLEMGWFQGREVDIENKLNDLINDGCIVSNFAKSFAKQFDGLSKIENYGEWKTPFVEFDLGGSIGFDKLDYQRFTDNGILEMTPMGEYVITSGLLTDKFGNFYSFDDWDNITKLGSFSEFLERLCNKKQLNFTKINIK
ncbi:MULTISPECIES: SUKH-3 domain-containing protein [unclassified Bartonella]|uniref:SUKH-3 domain-containing protein n=1 Tax=unclassified Bartonella TaxID=2645622 RepID=UPI0015F81E4D|nr:MULTISPECIES: SUKH-3 domain-containing protein [unclassified Bartonella]UXN03591.1 SUKH-3 domain-containing protein [Bartonella sp. HY406]